MVQLKGRMVKDNLISEKRVSIPHGPIKRNIIYVVTVIMHEFQFRMVQLKDFDAVAAFHVYYCFNSAWSN